ncbi:hypothetical protein VOLCADRAFT_83313 [Volvox carteri f. nagariensis]|uniref:fructose-bisphosphate aldolase n=1 Tax=Volvox carteri f. nagariensis TaxID=3068 RepID=D8UAC8_VOLCA|nr:uncharacterized protein VOLCADRAFT_83313 [Volvox carteri f. nagariensis]EFJ43246.1 hypothetical protein VOLCADRAFT_83313 [Volvox carteri f. nagariensis]|eukprot:XP_002955606.1 hypothetical protein VOLCADRAFT_83313 [Volvox carteri f. nagariensis]
MSLSKQKAASELIAEGDGAATASSRRTVQRPGASSKKSSGTRNAGGDNTGAIVISLLLAAAAIAATYWATTGSTQTRPAPPNTALRDIARQLLHPSKGILAADESPATFGKLLGKGVPNTLAVRRQWRHAVLSAPGLEDHISGLILHEETFIHGGPDVQSAASRGIAVGIKLDEGTVPLQPKKAGERSTRGLEGLAARCTRFRERGGAVFAKWRAVFRVGRHTPSCGAIRRNAADLAAFAAAAQTCGLLPILEPEVLAEGDHDLQRAAAAAARVLRGVFRALRRQPDVDPGGLLLKVAFVTPGQQAAVQAEPDQVANATLRVLLRTVPRVVPGIVFLSGGQGEAATTANLLAISRLAQERMLAGKQPLPWALSFSFGRALQSSALIAWQRGDVAEAQALLKTRAEVNAMAQQGQQKVVVGTLTEAFSPAPPPGGGLTGRVGDSGSRGG